MSDAISEYPCGFLKNAVLTQATRGANAGIPRFLGRSSAASEDEVLQKGKCHIAGCVFICSSTTYTIQSIEKGWETKLLKRQRSKLQDACDQYSGCPKVYISKVALAFGFSAVFDHLPCFVRVHLHVHPATEFWWTGGLQQSQSRDATNHNLIKVSMLALPHTFTGHA